MATLVLRTAGAAIGGALGGPVGAIIGQAAGSIAGSFIDQALFGGGNENVRHGPRLETTRILTAREGQAIPRVYGRARVSGEVIWATRFEEETVTQSTSAGGKGGGGGGQKTTTITYSYYANFAIALCEGPIGSIGRIWVDGKELDRDSLIVRIHRGFPNQLADPLIATKQGAGNTPHYTNTAYLVFERMPLENYGNRIPQVAVEVTRPISKASQWIRAVNMIPGATEFGYDPYPVSERVGTTAARKLNRHQTSTSSDFLTSFIDLISTCPRLEQVSLVVAWFGDDLRVGNCRVEPRVEVNSRTIIEGVSWSVAGTTRAQTRLVSRTSRGPAYGGTPSDTSVIRAVRTIRNSGRRVCINPFLMMDVPAGNGLPDPYGRAEQPVYPWRGRMTCYPAEGKPGSVNGTATAAAQVANFMNGSAGAKSYRNMILHYARLAVAAGGVDVFIIGSELRGLTRIRAQNDTFPFVDELKSLAAEVRAIVGSSTKITYGADWSEYFGYQPADGSNDVFYNLDPLWADANVNAVGIDNYMPVSDWRSGGAPDGVGRFSTDPEMLAANVARGEGYDWYYANETDRAAGNRTPITDASGKSWIYRYKDLKSWWGNPHYDRRGGVELGTASPWVPESKPIYFTEVGCPAVHNGLAQPNVFVDAKSSESAYPYFSSGGRDDQALLSGVQAQLIHWDDEVPGYDPANNPVSSTYGAPMVEAGQTQVWAWDARPFPAFPNRTDAWSDGPNWVTGHWLNGRLGAAPVADLIEELARSAGVDTIDTSGVYGVIDGYVLAEIASPRAALEGLMSLYRVTVHEDRGVLFFRSPGLEIPSIFDTDKRAYLDGQPSISLSREHSTELPRRATLLHMDSEAGYRDTDTASQREAEKGMGELTLTQPIAVSRAVVQPVVDDYLADLWVAREGVSFAIAPSELELSVGDQVSFDADPNAKSWIVTEIEDGDVRQVRAVLHVSGETVTAALAGAEDPQTPPPDIGIPEATLLNLPILAGTSGETNRVAVAADPWPGPSAVYVSETSANHRYVQLVETSAVLGTLLTPLTASDIVSRVDLHGTVDVELAAGRLQSVDEAALLGGANAFAVASANGEWEVFQAMQADLIAANTYRLSGLVRGQLGSEPEAEAGAQIGARIVLLDRSVVELEGAEVLAGLARNWLIGPTRDTLGSFTYTRLDYAPGLRGYRPYRPTGLAAEQMASGNLSISWIRRDRLAGEGWDATDIVMSEASEFYRVEVLASGALLHSQDVASAQLTVPQSALGGQQPDEIRVAQVSDRFGPGPVATLDI
jgi:hypothetical protein